LSGADGIERFGSGGPWEPIVGYARVVRAGPHVWVSGCTSSGEHGVVVGTTPAEQAELALANLLRALEQAGATRHDVVRTRIYVTDISRWEEVGRAHGIVFGDVRPAATLVEVKGLVDPRMLVEIDADAYVQPPT